MFQLPLLDLTTADLRKAMWSYVTSKGYNLEASFLSCCDSGETEEGEHTSLNSRVCSETTNESSLDTIDAVKCSTTELHPQNPCSGNLWFQ